MLPRWSPAPHIQRQLIVCSCLLAHLFCYHRTLADTSFNQSLIKQITDETRDADGAAPEAAVSPAPGRTPGLSTYLLTVRLGGEEAYATPMLIGITQAVIADQLRLQADTDACQVVEAANVTQCVDGAPVPSADSEVYFPPQTGPNELSAYLRQMWRSTSNVPAPPYQGLDQSQVPQMDTAQYFSKPDPGTTSGRRLLGETGSRRLHEAPAPLGCYDECQITLKISFPYAKTEEQWNSTIDFFVSGRFLAKMQSKDINLLNAQLLGYQEPASNSTPKPLDPTRKANPQEIHTFGPQGGSQQQNASALEFTLQVVGDDANVTNDALLGALYGMIVTPQPGVSGSQYLSSDNTAITIIRSAPPVSVGVALGRRLMAMSSSSMLSGLRKLLQQAPPPLVPVDSSNIPKPQFNVSKPSMDITFRLRAVPAQSVMDVRDAVNGLIQGDQFLRGFQDRGISVYQVSLQSFNFLPAPAPQGGPPAPPPVLILATRKSSDGPRTTIIVVAVVPVTVLAIALGIFAVYWVRRQKQQNQAYSSRDSHAKLTLKGSELSGGSSFSDHLSDKAVSAATIIKRMHPDSLSQSGFLDMSWSDWKIDPQEITILTRPDGSEWLLGSGASGRVYKALRNGVQIVAVKLFKEEMTRGAINSLTSPKHAEQFRREINILKTCHDKNIVQFLGACLTDTQTIMVTEYLENGDLYNAINSQQGGRYHWYRMQQPDGRPVPNSGMARRVALDVARGLHFLHTKKIVHFDLKSANILLARDFTAKIADVGLARILQDDMLSTRKEVGTFAWAAPEVLLGQRTTEAADIYSFGVLLHELSALESPCGQRHLRRVRVPEECPPEVHDLMYRCLDPNQRNRPSARDLVAALSCLPAVPPFPPPPRLASRDSPSHSRHNSFSRSSFSVQCHPIVEHPMEERLRQPGI